MLPPHVAAFVERFAMEEHYLACHDEAENMCGVITYTFTMQAKMSGMTEKLAWARCFRAKDITRPHRDGILSNFHTFPVWDGIAIDFTARQFWLDADFPVIEPLETYRTRFTRVDLHAVADMGFPEGRGIQAHFSFGVT